MHREVHAISTRVEWYQLDIQVSLRDHHLNED
jgi:hypothetical protein